MSKQIFDSRECDDCGEWTYVKPDNGKPAYCGVCGADLVEQNSISYSLEADDD